MIREYIRVKTVVQRALDRQEVICDNCNKVVGKEDGLFQVTTHHDRWDYDSIESYETHHFCCKRCMDTFLDDYWENPKNTDAADIEFFENTDRAGHSPDDNVQRVFEEEAT